MFLFLFVCLCFCFVLFFCFLFLGGGFFVLSLFFILLYFILFINMEVANLLIKCVCSGRRGGGDTVDRLTSIESLPVQQGFSLEWSQGINVHRIIVWRQLEHTQPLGGIPTAELGIRTSCKYNVPRLAFLSSPVCFVNTHPTSNILNCHFVTQHVFIFLSFFRPFPVLFCFFFQLSTA